MSWLGSLMVLLIVIACLVVLFPKADMGYEKLWKHFSFKDNDEEKGQKKDDEQKND